MSVKMMNMVFDRFPHGGNDMVLALAIADHAHDDGTHIYPGNERLAKKTRMSERTITRLLAKFEQIGWLIKVKNGNSGRGNANEFNISENWLKGDNLSTFISAIKVDKKTERVTNDAQKVDIAVSTQQSLTINTTKTTPREETPIAEIKPMKPEGTLACRLIPLGVLVTSIHPTLCKWIADKISNELIDECVALARLQKPLPEKIAANYLDSIIRNEIAKNLRPKKPDKSWMMSDAGIDAKAREMGVMCPPSIQKYSDFAKYLEKIIVEQQKIAA